MKLTTINNVNEFLVAVDKCKGNVYLTSAEGDKINLKSKLSQYVAIGALVRNNELELWCDNKDDERVMIDFFTRNPEVND